MNSPLRNMVISLLNIFIFLLLFSCQSYTEAELAYIKSIDEWHQKRIASLKEKDSWFSLAGLFWLEEGENSFGSDESNDIVFPEDKSADFMGWFYLEDQVVKIKVKSGIKIVNDNNPVEEMSLKNDMEGKPTTLHYGSLSWYVIKREDKFGIRLKDSENPDILNFEGIDRFPVKPEWRIKAEFIPYDPVKMIEIPTVLGTITKEKSPGVLNFTIEGQKYSLDPLGNPGSDSYFVIFADLTNGKETYGAGRFLSVKRAHADSSFYIDFNKAYNPPCAFTKYATCPLPPKQNQLPLEITAGEKKYGDH